MIFTSKKEKKISTTLILTALTISLLPVLMSATPVNATDGTKIIVLPVQNTFYANATSPGTAFIVNATVVNVTDLQNWQIKFTWDSNLLSFVNVSLPPDNVFAASGKAPINPPVESGPDYMIWGCTYINGDPGTPGYWTFNGTGTLCRIALRIKAPPSFPATTHLTFTEFTFNTFLLNGRGIDIAFTVDDGVYSYIDELAATLTPPSPVLVEAGQGATFMVAARNGRLPYRYQWYFKYPNGTEMEDTGAENQTTWTTPPVTKFGNHVATARVSDSANARVNASAIVRRTGGPVVFIDPPKIIDPSLIPGDTFNVNVSITNASTLNSWSASVFYSNTLLMATEAVEGDFLMSFGSTTFSFTIQNDFNSTHGRVQMTCALASGEAEGNGQLANVTFQVLDYGATPIALADISLLDSLGSPVPSTSEDGYFNNVLLAKLAIDPSEVSGPEYLPGTTFTVNVTLDDVENLRTCIFNLNYTPWVIQEINIYTPPVSGQAPVKRLQIDDDAGFILANLTYRNGITTYEPVPIMTVEFQVLAMGVSPINLTDTQLYDMDGLPVAHEVHHGIFIGLIRDVAVLDVTTDLNIAYQGWIVQINVTVKNKGNVTETFDVKIYYNATLGPTETVTDLPPNEETLVVIEWNTTLVPYYSNYNITAEAGPVPFEFNLGDNTLQMVGYVRIRIMGDIDDNGVVDMRDISAVTNAYGSHADDPPPTKYNLYLDLNRDRRIDLRDIGIVCNNFMKHA